MATIQTVAEKVFGTAELLELIVIELPPSSVGAVRGVAKAWKATVDDATLVRQHRCLQLVHSDVGGSFKQPKHGDGLVHVSNSSEFFIAAPTILHPLIERHAGLEDPSRYRLSVTEIRHDIRALRSFAGGRHFISEPPMSATELHLAIFQRIRFKKTLASCTIYVKTGITFTDLIAVERALIAGIGSVTLRQRAYLYEDRWDRIEVFTMVEVPKNERLRYKPGARRHHARS